MGGLLGLFGLGMAFRKKLARIIVDWFKEKDWPGLRSRLGSSRGEPGQPEEAVQVEAEAEGFCERCHGRAKMFLGEAMEKIRHNHTV
jgi:hypothetical protein